MRKEENKKQIIGMVQSQRKLLYRIGTRKLHHLLHDELVSKELKLPATRRYADKAKKALCSNHQL
jgi:hypothetical protein